MVLFLLGYPQSFLDLDLQFGPFINFLNFLAIMKIFILLYSLVSFWYSIYTYVVPCDILSQFLYVLFLFFSFFFFLLQFGKFYQSIFKLTDYLLGCIQSTNEPSKAFFSFLLHWFDFCYLILSQSFHLYARVREMPFSQVE